MRKLTAIAIMLLLWLAPVTAWADGENLTTLTFSGSAFSISTAQKKSIQNLVAKERVQTSITCNAFISKSASSAAKTLANKRAKAVCDQAKTFALKGVSTKVNTVTTISKALLGKVDLRVAFDSGPETSVTFANLDPIWTEEVAWEKVQTFLKSVPAVTLNPSLRFTNSVSSTRKTQAQNQLNQVYRFWSPYFKPDPAQVDALYWHDKDLSVAQSTYDQMLRGGSSLNKLRDGIIYGKTNYCAHASAVRLNTLPQTFVFHQCVGTGSTSLAELHTTPHEYTHFVHFQFGAMPIWLTEGSATFYGEALGIYSVDYGRRVLDAHRNALFQSYDVALGKPVSSNTLKNLLRKNDVATVKSLFASLEGVQAPSQADNTAAYLLGSFATGALVASFGHEAFVEFMKSFSTSSNYSDNFNKAFGITPSQFYEYLTPYLAKNPSVRG